MSDVLLRCDLCHEPIDGEYRVADHFRNTHVDLYEELFADDPEDAA